MSIVAVTSLALEASIARGPRVSVLCSQGLALSSALGAAIARGASGIISFGIAGGLAPDLVVGDWVVASGVKHGADVIATDRSWAQRLLERLPDAIHAEVLGANILIPSPLEKFRLYNETGAAPSIWNRILRQRLRLSIAFRLLLAVSSSTQPTERFHPLPQ